MSAPRAHPPIQDLIPHEPPMVWLDELLDWEPGFARCRVTIGPHTALVGADGLETVALLEHMAQAVAACLGYGALTNGEDIRVGMIVACRTFEVGRAQVPIGAVLTVEARRLREVDAVSNFECRVDWAGERVASAQMTLYHASEPPS